MMIKVKLVVRVMKDGELIGGHTKSVELPFVPTIGMKFKEGISTRLWETVNGNELSPGVEHIIYDFDEECVVALFEVSEHLSSNFWITINPEHLGITGEMHYFDCV